MTKYNTVNPQTKEICKIEIESGKPIKEIAKIHKIPLRNIKRWIKTNFKTGKKNYITKRTDELKQKLIQFYKTQKSIKGIHKIANQLGSAIIPPLTVSRTWTWKFVKDNLKKPTELIL